MFEKPMVSIVIPFYNNLQWLEEAVESVMCQTYENYEIILVNDGSKEDMRPLLVKYPKIRYFYQNNSGAGSARNRGIKEAEGKYIAFLDSDDIWLPKKLENQVAFMEENNQYMWAHCSYQTFGMGEAAVMSSKKAEGNMYPKCLASCRVATPCVIIRRECFLKNTALRFHESMRYGQDFYLWVLLCSEYELGAQEEVMCRVRMRGSNAGKRAYVMLKAKAELRKNLMALSSFPWKDIPLLTKAAYNLCHCDFTLVNSLEKIVKSTKGIELISKLLYVVPYMMLRMELTRYK